MKFQGFPLSQSVVWLWLTNLGSLQWSNLVKALNLINKFKTLGKHKREEIFLK